MPTNLLVGPILDDFSTRRQHAAALQCYRNRKLDLSASVERKMLPAALTSGSNHVCSALVSEDLCYPIHS